MIGYLCAVRFLRIATALLEQTAEIFDQISVLLKKDQLRKAFLDLRDAVVSCGTIFRSLGSKLTEEDFL